MAISRRNLLAAAGLGMAGAVVGVARVNSEPETPVPQTDWNALRTRLTGELFTSADSGYGSAKLAFNPLFDTRQPAAIARCADLRDVQACVELAARTRIPVAARGGGHSYAGYSTPDQGLIIDMSAVNTVALHSAETAVIGAGARLIDVYAGLAEAGRCLPAGSCPTVGIAGLTLGGGLGVLTGKYGLTCDTLVSAQIVTADGTARTASADSEPDLYWALRGGGGGNFGVVTAFTFRTTAMPNLTVCKLQFPAGAVTEVLGGWQTFLAEAPDEFWSTLGISAGSPPSCRINGCFVGGESDLNPVLDKLIAATGTRPSSRVTAAMGYLQAMLYFGGCTNIPVRQCRPNWNADGGVLGRDSFTASARVLRSPLAEPARLTDLLTGRDGVDVLLDSLRGAVTRIGVTDTAFPYRDALATAQIYAGATTPEARRTVTEIRDGLGALVGNTGYVNYIDPDLADWASAYYGVNADRLRGVARRYDPDGVFAFDQSAARI
ncbi:FAD-binding oxidoreductase [Nocardia sp. 2]|uniref:FAD-binding oxidoreductase n=1 Tax=Nocardia acididurans TaxID=2802282 RepID=A0ABS1MAB7_9NOCA|nr:FAD-binding oxidoreductase [Nocardia acididurans]MBL1077194.1 FAD-binding oxidoreductase [Nocardia acididurans]